MNYDIATVFMNNKYYLVSSLLYFLRKEIIIIKYKTVMIIYLENAQFVLINTQIQY